jgi:glycosyltransferase involved in cell wall biosynthesis
MACGTPLVTSDANGLREIAGDAALFVDPEDDRDMANALGRVLSDEEFRAALSAQGLERAKLFHWEKCARETLSIVEGLCPAK